MKKPKIKDKKYSLGNILSIIVLFAAIGLCLFAGSNLYSIFGQYKAGSDEYAKIKEMVVEVKAAKDEVKGDIKVPEVQSHEILDAPIDIDFTELEKINPDIVGWLYVEAIPTISYPVVKGEDNDYYLHRTYEKQDNFAGAIFIDCKNKKDMTSPNTIIYGHNMKNGTMFGKLKEFKDPEVFQKSPYIWMITPDRDIRYEIFSSYTAAVDSDTYTLFKGPGKELVEYGYKMQSLSNLIRDPVDFEEQDKIITLSTCTGEDTTRYVVQAVSKF